jgi:hypothetical protein
MFDQLPDSGAEEFPDFDVLKPLVLLLGNVSHEGITSSLRAGGEQYKQKLLVSTVANWSSIVRIFGSFRVRAVVVKVNAWAYRNFAHPEYRNVRDELLTLVAKVPHIFFVYEDILSGGITEESGAFQAEFIRRRGGDVLDEEDLRLHRELFGFDLPAEEVLREAESAFRRFDITLVPYRTNADVTVMSVQFLEEALQNLLFRVYIPAGRLWANEVDRLLSLFRDYLLGTGRTGVRLDQSRTDHGVSYEFHSTGEAESTSIETEFRDFAHLLDLSLSNPAAAEGLLLSRNVDAKQVEAIVTRYAKEAYRLQVDIKHDRERKLLAIRQRLESELTEVLPPSAWAGIQALIERSIPSTSGIQASFAIDSVPLPNPAQYRSLTVNLNPQIIQEVNGIVSQEIRGNVNIGPRGEELLALIEEHAPSQSMELASAVHQLSDPNLPQAERLTASGKLKSFLYKLAPEVGKVGLNVFQAYIEHKLGLK